MTYRNVLTKEKIMAEKKTQPLLALKNRCGTLLAFCVEILMYLNMNLAFLSDFFCCMGRKVHKAMVQ
ncbi:MAG: hypothetical protein LIO74_05830, partial [Ruminococcus sp.]|nr:hypothetical protein [Ruminococcus sp.]